MVLQPQGSVEDVEWGDDASGDGTGDGSEVESEKSAASAAGAEDVKGPSFKPAGLSSIGEVDVQAAAAKASADRASFASSWMSEGEGEDFGEGDSADGKEEVKASPDKDPVDKKEEKPKDSEGAQAAPAEPSQTAEESTPAAADGEEPPSGASFPPADEDAEARDVTLHVEGGDGDAEPAEGAPAGEDEPPPEGDLRPGGDDLPPGAPILEAPASARVSVKSESSEPEKRRRCYQKVWNKLKRWQMRFAIAFARVRDRHTIKVRIVLIPVFICMSPIFLLWIFYKAGRYCLRQMCRNEEKEAEEAERKAAAEEAARVAAAIAAGPQRSKLKPPVSAIRAQDRFGRKRNLAKSVHGDGEMGDDDETSYRKRHGGRMNLADAKKELQGDARKKRFAEQREQDMAALGKGRRPKDPLWRRALPSRWPRYFRDWWRARNAYFKRVFAVIDTIEDEEEFDWDNLDESGNPAQNKFFFPKILRRRGRFCMLVYIDPLIELLDNWPLFVKGIRWLIRLMPLFAMLGSFAWFGYNLWRNLRYVPGECIVERLPLMFETTGKIDEMVTAGYIVRRMFVASPTRPAGSVIQECIANVPCSKMDYGATNAYDDDRCVVFQAWKLGDEIPCYYEQGDFWGDKGTELSCLSLPSKMERETFTVVIAVVINALICVILGIYKWRVRDLARQADLANSEAQKAEEEEAAAKKLIEEKEAEEALKQAEAVNRELGIGEEGDEEAMGDMAAMVAAIDDEAADQERD